MVMSSSHGSEKMERLLEKYQIKNFVKMGSSLKGCVVAKGEAELYYRFNPTMEWDTAAMQCIVEEAGAIFRQMDDTPMLYNRQDSLNAKGFYIINSSENKLELDGE
jgi:3'(2'), 5'-bisphosphate nucleotidase